MAYENNNDINRFLMATGTASFKFDPIGATAEGEVVDLEVQQQRDIKTGEPKFWPDGKPQLQLKVTLATDDRDDKVEDDNGQRAVYVRGQMRVAVAEAVRAAGAKEIEVGGHLKVRYDSDGEATQRGFNPPKIYKAKYTAPAPAAVSVDDF